MHSIKSSSQITTFGQNFHEAVERGTLRKFLLMDRRNLGLGIGEYGMSGLVKGAILNVCKTELARNELYCTRTYPLNRINFYDLDFLPF